jgi:Domain of unknown function (DUF1995)
MLTLPQSLEEAIAQAQTATKSALADGYKRIQVELVFPEIDLKAQVITKEFISIFADNLAVLKIFFTDSGAAALAKRDWGKTEFKINDVGTSRSPMDGKITDEDEIFIFVSASSMEVLQVEKFCELIGDRPVIFLNPRLEDAAIVGIGYAARQLRERFLNNIFSCYYVRPLDGAALFRCYPQQWQVFLQENEDYNLIAELPKKPMGDELDQILGKVNNEKNPEGAKPKTGSFFTDLQRFLKALTN